MVFADLKNDFVFRRIFAGHPDILRGLLDDLLDRHGDRANEATFSRGELEAYRKVMDEIQQAREYGDARHAEGEAKGKLECLLEGKREGAAEGTAKAILVVLETRGIAVSQEARARIVACTEPTTLARWLARAVTAGSAEEVIAP